MSTSNSSVDVSTVSSSIAAPLPKRGGSATPARSEGAIGKSLALLQPLGGSYAWLVWTIATVFVVYLFSFQTGYAIVNPSVQKDVSLSVAQVAEIAAVYTWVFAVCQFFGGALLDRLGAHKVTTTAIALVTIGIFLFANATSYQMLLLSQVILATGSCVGFVGAGYVGGQWFGMAKFSAMFGLVQFVASVTSAFTQNLIDFTLKHTDWRSMFNWSAAFGVVLFVLSLVYVRNPTPIVSDSKGGVGGFFSGVVHNLVEVGKVPHVWVTGVVGAALFGAMLSLGVVWAPKLLAAHGINTQVADLGASLLWLGLATGSIIVIRWSDHIRRRKLPIILGALAQLLTLGALLYLSHIGPAFALTMCFLFGFANAAHMLTFSSAADVVKPAQIGTSAAIVNGLMFIAGGLMIDAPGARIGVAQHAGRTGLAVAQFAGLPVLIALLAALVIALFMKETYPAAEQSAETSR